MKKIISLLLLVSATAMADTRVIVPFAAGGAFDLVGRQFAQFVEKETKTTVSVENVTGAGSLVGTKRLQSSEPNTLMMTSSSFYNNIAKGEFKLEEFTPVSIVATAPLFLITNKEKNLTCEKLRDTGTKFFMGHAGKDSITSTPARFVLEKYSNFVEVPYKGISQAAVDLLGNQIQLMFVSGLSSVKPQFQILANTTESKYDAVPTMKECLSIDKTVQTQWILLASPGSDPKFVKEMNELAKKFANSEDSQKYFAKQGMINRAGSLDAARSMMITENENWKSLLK